MSGLLPLVIVLCRVEGAGSVVLLTHSKLEIQVGMVRTHTGVGKHMTLVEVAVGRTAVGAHIARADMRFDLAAERHAGVATHGAKRTGLEVQVETLVLVAARHYVDGSAEGRSAEHTCSSTLENFDALNVGKRNREIGGVVTRLWVGNVDAIQENGNLVKRTAVD